MHTYSRSLQAQASDRLENWTCNRAWTELMSRRVPFPTKLIDLCNSHIVKATFCCICCNGFLYFKYYWSARSYILILQHDYSTLIYGVYIDNLVHLDLRQKSCFSRPYKNFKDTTLSTPFSYSRTLYRKLQGSTLRNYGYCALSVTHYIANWCINPFITKIQYFSRKQHK